MVIGSVIVGCLSALVHVLLARAGRGYGRVVVCLVGLVGSGRFILVVIVNDYDLFGRLAAKVFIPIDGLVPLSLCGSAVGRSSSRMRGGIRCRSGSGGRGSS